jgi:serine/threonine-protein kinase HipA
MMSSVPRSGEVAGRRSRTLSVWSNGQRVGLRFAAWLMQLPQEDFYQALGVAPHLKYEADGGPGVRSLAPVLRNSVISAEALRTLVATQILLGMLAAPDRHAKKFSLQLLAAGRYRRALLDNVMSVWPVVDPEPGQGSWHKAKMAMPEENRHYPMKDIECRHFNALGCSAVLARMPSP